MEKAINNFGFIEIDSTDETFDVQLCDLNNVVPCIRSAHKKMKQNILTIVYVDSEKLENANFELSVRNLIAYIIKKTQANKQTSIKVN